MEPESPKEPTSPKAKSTSPKAIKTEPYALFSREAPWKDQGRELLENQEDFERWLPKFRPDLDARYEWRIQKLDKRNGYGFEVEPPISYPAIVVCTRIRRIGLTECEFYWDYVYPADFTTSEPEPSDV